MGIINKYHDNPYEIITVLSTGANFAVDSRLALAKYAGLILGFIKLVNDNFYKGFLVNKS